MELQPPILAPPERPELTDANRPSPPGEPGGVDLSPTCHNGACPEVSNFWYSNEIQWDNCRSHFAS